MTYPDSMGPGGGLTTLVPHFWGIYHAVVVNNADPKQGNRVKLKIPQVLGTAISNWAPNVNSTAIPNVGAAVFAMFTGGDRTKPVYFLAENPGIGSTVVEMFGAVNTFGALTSATTTASGHTFVATAVPGWSFGPGAAVFYTDVMSDGQIVMSALPFTENELLPTANHAEIDVFDPLRFKFYNLTIPTSTGATVAVEPGDQVGGTDAGAGDLRRVVHNNVEYLVFTCGGYYFNWNISTTGLYPAIGFLNRNTTGDWQYDQAISLTGDQWEATNPTVYTTTIAPGGQNTGVGGTYWPTGTLGQMAVFPQSGNVVIGHYFGTQHAGSTSGCISVVDTAGNLLCSYQIPNIVPMTGTMTFAAVRDVETDPTSALNDERFVILYDGFVSNTPHHPVQEFSYNANAQTITPKSVPCITTDTNSDFSFSIIDNLGNLYITQFDITNGLAAKNVAVYKKNAGERNIVSQAPATGSWWSAGTWGTKVPADFSLNFANQQGFGALAGPLTMDPVTGALLVPGATGRFSAAVPQTGNSLGSNLLTGADSTFEAAQILTADDATFATSIGTWFIFIGSGLARTTSPPIAPPFGTDAAQCNPAFSNITIGSGDYAVNGNSFYQFRANTLASTTGRQCEVWIRWKDNTHATISDTTHTVAFNTTTAWTTFDVVAQAPSNAAFANFWVEVDSAAETHYFASNFFWDLTLGDFTGWTQFLTTFRATTAAAHSGTFSMFMQAPFNNEVLSATSTRINVVPFQEYKASAWFLANTVSQNCNIFIRFFDGSNNFLVQAGPTLTVQDNTSTWTQASTSGWAPKNAATAAIVIEPTTTTAGEVHYVDDVVFQTQPFTANPYVDFGVNTLRQIYNVIIGRGCVTNRRYYIPLATTFNGTESAAYHTATYVPARKPQFLASIDLAKVLSR